MKTMKVNSAFNVTQELDDLYKISCSHDSHIMYNFINKLVFNGEIDWHWEYQKSVDDALKMCEDISNKYIECFIGEPA